MFIENVLDWIGVGIAEINRMGTLKSLQKEPLPSRTIIILEDFSLEPNRLDLVDPREFQNSNLYIPASRA